MGKCEFLNKSIIAHRGIYNNITIYENSLDAIMYAVKNNLSVSIDVRCTNDEIIVFGDKDGARFLKLKDDINTLSKEELDYISNYNIPKLVDVLNSVNGKVPILINIYYDDKVFRNKLINILDKYKGMFVILSDSYDIIKHYKKKKYNVGLIIDDSNLRCLSKNYDVDVLNIKYNLLDKREVNVLKDKYYVIASVIDNRKDAEYFIKIYNNLIIDNVEEVFR